MRWLTADDYSRTVIAWDWLQNPRIYSGVWLSPHFWLNGFFIWLIPDLTLAPFIVSTLFSIGTLIFLYLIFEKIFGKFIAVVSVLIYCVFPFQVWLSSSAMPEFPFFFFVTAGAYYFILWYDNLINNNYNLKLLTISAIFLMFSTLFRYEGWFFAIAFIIIVIITSYKKYKFTKIFFLNFSVSIVSVIGMVWWLIQNYIDYSDTFYFIKETAKIYSGLSNAGLIQRSIQYPFFIFYIAPFTAVLGLWKIIQTIRNKQNGFHGNFRILRIFLLFNGVELLLLMFSGIVGSSGTNMISRYIVLNAIFFFPFAVWQLTNFKNYILYAGTVILIIVNIVWSFYYQQAYREDTYEVAEISKKLIQMGYFSQDDKIYFEIIQGYYDIYPIKVISNHPEKIISDTIPAYFSVEPPASKKLSGKKLQEEQLKLNILEFRKFIEQKNIKLFIVRSDLMIDKLQKLSYKSEQIGDYRIFYISEGKIFYKRGVGIDSTGKIISYINGNNSVSENEISFDKKLILKEFNIDNANFGVNPQTISLKWQIADGRILDSLKFKDDEYGRYKTHIQLKPAGSDSIVYDSYSSIFSERNIEDFFQNEEFKSILVIKPFAVLNYSIKFKPSPFESGLYNIHLSVYDELSKSVLPVYKGDSLFVDSYEFVLLNDSLKTDSLYLKKKISEHKANYTKRPYYPIGKIIAMFPNTNYNAVMRKSSDLSKVIIRNSFMLPFLNRYQGDHMLDIVFTYF